MLTSLQIDNYLLIHHLEIGFHDGFSVLTGQTGAGKSIIIGALNMLLGQRADARVVRSGATRCTIEGHFNITSSPHINSRLEELDIDISYPSDTILRRDINANGKSRAFINDTPVSLSQLREIATQLVDIHSQHQNLALSTREFQTYIVDTIAHNQKLLVEYGKAYRQRSDTQREIEHLKQMAESSNERADYIRYQLNTIRQAKLKDGEQEELEAELELLEHAEEIKSNLYTTLSILENDGEGVIERLRQSLQSLRQASTKFSQAVELSSRVESTLIELRDIHSEIYHSVESINFDANRMEQVSQRLDTIYTLHKRHHTDSIGQLLTIEQQYSNELDTLQNSDQQIADLEHKLTIANKNMEQKATLLTQSRKVAADSVTNDICHLLKPLGIPNVQFQVEVSDKFDYDDTGHDNIRFLFSANRSVEMQELSAVASGGELSRVMLSIKSLLAGAQSLPTIILDEIDTGVSGAIADRMATMMQQISMGGHQVIAITHLPQIAARGTHHYKVYKQEHTEHTETLITELKHTERIAEIAGMMSGEELTQAAIENAKSLIEKNG